MNSEKSLFNLLKYCLLIQESEERIADNYRRLRQRGILGGIPFMDYSSLARANGKIVEEAFFIHSLDEITPEIDENYFS